MIFFRLSSSWASLPIRTTLIGLGGRGFFIFLFPRVHEAWFLNCAKSALAASSKRNSYLRSTGNDAAAALLQKCTSSCQLLGSIQQHLHVQNSSKQLLSFHHFSSGLCPNSKSVLLLLFKLAKTKSSILLANSRSRKSIRYFSAK